MIYTVNIFVNTNNNICIYFFIYIYIKYTYTYIYIYVYIYVYIQILIRGCVMGGRCGNNRAEADMQNRNLKHTILAKGSLGKGNNLNIEINRKF